MQTRTPTLVFILEESFYGPLKSVVSAVSLLIYTPVVPLANLHNVANISYKIEIVCLNWLQLRVRKYVSQESVTLAPAVLIWA